MLNGRVNAWPCCVKHACAVTRLRWWLAWRTAVSQQEKVRQLVLWSNTGAAPAKRCFQVFEARSGTHQSQAHTISMYMYKQHHGRCTRKHAQRSPCREPAYSSAQQH
eukprot:TRINITY_DN15310_c0_g2_i3.p1 TRINITY_DN15310_c0_g2~~TRINITY_DN15310_c0_g2_i3.p1  ORF type:complete len:107 (+),score=11.28 TRINITY_DN15310_c0_g2_i3:41-361(+)